MKKLIALVVLFLIEASLSVAAGPAPFISDLKVDPSSGPSGTVYTISVHIVRPQDPGNIEAILHQLREGVESIDVPIRDDGLEGDAVKGDGIYTGRSSVPGTASKGTHRFEVFIEDKTGGKSNVLEYRFTVLKGESI
jgi:hypothetical protein